MRCTDAYFPHPSKKWPAELVCFKHVEDAKKTSSTTSSYLQKHGRRMVDKRRRQFELVSMLSRGQVPRSSSSLKSSSSGLGLSKPAPTSCKLQNGPGSAATICAAACPDKDFPHARPHNKLPMTCFKSDAGAAAGSAQCGHFCRFDPNAETDTENRWTNVMPGMPKTKALLGGAVTPCELGPFQTLLPRGFGYYFDPLLNKKGLCEKISPQYFYDIHAAYARLQENDPGDCAAGYSEPAGSKKYRTGDEKRDLKHIKHIADTDACADECDRFGSECLGYMFSPTEYLVQAQCVLLRNAVANAPRHLDFAFCVRVEQWDSLSGTGDHFKTVLPVDVILGFCDQKAKCPTSGETKNCDLEAFVLNLEAGWGYVYGEYKPDGKTCKKINPKDFASYRTEEAAGRITANWAAKEAIFLPAVLPRCTGDNAPPICKSPTGAPEVSTTTTTTTTTNTWASANTWVWNAPYDDRVFSIPTSGYTASRLNSAAAGCHDQMGPLFVHATVLVLDCMVSTRLRPSLFWHPPSHPSTTTWTFPPWDLHLS